MIFISKSFQLTLLTALLSAENQISSVTAQLFFPPGPPCGSTKDKFKVETKTDGSGEDITWLVEENQGGDFVEYFGNGADYGNPYGDSTVYRENYCFLKDKCWKFIINDSAGDGLCCESGKGGYRVTYDDEVITESRFKNKATESVIFGNCECTGWDKLGRDIDGENSGDYFGSGLSLSADGTRVAVASNSYVRVLDYVDEAWVQVGDTFNGAFGRGVDLSSDGNTLAIMASGHCEVHEFDGGSWVQVGGNIIGGGTAVSISSDGTIVAIGSLGGGCCGTVDVFELLAVGGSWNRIGNTINGENSLDFFGRSVSLSSDGTRVAAGATGYDVGSDQSVGFAQVFDFVDGAWVQTGNDLVGEARYDEYGSDVSLSGDGSTLAVGAPYHKYYLGEVKVYGFEAGPSDWVQIGSDINGEGYYGATGQSVALSDDGSIVAIGSEYENYYKGQTEVYEFVDGSWTQIGKDLNGEKRDDFSGSEVALSADGKTVAFSARYNDAGGSNAGHVRVYGCTYE